MINADSSRAGRPLVEGILVSDKASYEEVCECVVMRRWSPHAGRPGAEVTRSTEFAGVLENKDSVLVRCRLGEGVGAISPPSLDTLWVLGDQEERYLPWCEYFYLVQPGLTCHLVYRPDRGSVWEIVPWKIVDAVEGTSIKIKMEKVCFP